MPSRHRPVATPEPTPTRYASLVSLLEDALAGEIRDDVRARVDVVELEDPSPGAALRALRHSHELRAVLCEGGPTLNRALLADGVLDELFLTVAPQLVGGEEDVLRVLAGDPLPEPMTLELLGVLRHGSELFLRYGIVR